MVSQCETRSQNFKYQHSQSLKLSTVESTGYVIEGKCLWPPSKVPRFRHQHFFNSLRSCSHDDLIASKFQGKDSTIVFPKAAIVNTVMDERIV